MTAALPSPQLTLPNGQNIPVVVAPDEQGVMPNSASDHADYTLPMLYIPSIDRAQWLGVVRVTDPQDLGAGHLGLLTVKDFSTPEPTATFKTFGMSDVLKCQEVADKTIVGLQAKFPEATLIQAELAGLAGLETPERLAILAEQSQPHAEPKLAQPLVFSLGNSQSTAPATPITFYHHAPTDTALGVGIHHSGQPDDPAQVWFLKIAGSQTNQPAYSLTEYIQDDWHECQTIACSVANHLADNPALTRQLGMVQGLSQFEHVSSVPVDQRERLKPDLTDARTVARDLLNLPSLETPMATSKTYPSGYAPNEEPPAPNDPKGYRGPGEEAPTASSNLVISGSRHWDVPQGQEDDGRWKKLNGYVNAIVERAQEENMRIIVGDNPQGVDWAVINACDKKGVECRVYGIGREPRNPKVGTSEHCQYVQVQKEDVETVHEGGANHEPEHERRLRLLQYTERDQRMVEAAGENGRVLCIWNGDSGGTKRTFDYAGEIGQKADLIQWNGERFTITDRTYDVPSAGLTASTPANTPAVPAQAEAPIVSVAEPEPATPSPASVPALVLPDSPTDLTSAFAEACDLTNVAPPAPAAFTLPEVALNRLGYQSGPQQPAAEELAVYYDPRQDKGFWVGVIEGKEPEDLAQTCVLAVHDLSTSAPHAYIAPVLTASSEKCHETGQVLVDILQDEPNVERFMGVVEGMSRQSGTHGLWNKEDGVKLPNATSDELRTQFYQHPVLDL